MHPYDICVQCGYCCTVSTCIYGEWDLISHCCKYLGEENERGQRLCTIYDQIYEKSRPSISPAFGSGCSSNLFNEQRKRVQILLTTN